MYRSYKVMNLEIVNNTFNMNFCSISNNNSNTQFEKKFFYVLNIQASLKTKLMQYNKNAFMLRN